MSPGRRFTTEEVFRAFTIIKVETCNITMVSYKQRSCIEGQLTTFTPLCFQVVSLLLPNVSKTDASFSFPQSSSYQQSRCGLKFGRHKNLHFEQQEVLLMTLILNPVRMTLGHRWWTLKRRQEYFWLSTGRDFNVGKDVEKISEMFLVACSD